MILGGQERLHQRDAHDIEFTARELSENRRIVSSRPRRSNTPEGVAFGISQMPSQISEDGRIAALLAGRAPIQLAEMDEEIDKVHALCPRKSVNTAEKRFV